MTSPTSRCVVCRANRLTVGRPKMLDFTSTHYLGMQHASHTLAPWSALTTGVPAALYEVPEQRVLQADLAHLLNKQTTMLGVSTLHLFWDLFGLLADNDTAVYVDEYAYPIARSAAERAVSRGGRLRTLPHHDVDLARQLIGNERSRRSIIVTDGFCTACGKAAPLADYLHIAAQHSGLVVVDDTQALGVLGRLHGAADPLGIGGGGICARQGATDRHLLTISSMNKAFGVPLAVLGGSRDWLNWFQERSETRMHCSPPSLANLHAGTAALQRNRTHGDGLRSRLAGLIGQFRRWVQQIGIVPAGGYFPVQSLPFRSLADASALHADLLAQGIRTVLRRLQCGGRIGVSFVITAAHQTHDIHAAVRALAGTLGRSSRFIQEPEHEYGI